MKIRHKHVTSLYSHWNM